MKLVLLPGMDGTGNLFDEFVSFYRGETAIISFPHLGSQSYEDLSAFVVSKLPKEDHILLAESFSGGLIPHLIQHDNKHTKGIIFVASFLSCPRPSLIRLVLLLPIKRLSSIPGANLMHRLLFLGWDVQESIVATFTSTISNLPEATLKSRLRSILSLKNTMASHSSLPCVYIRPISDLLIPEGKAKEIPTSFTNCSYRPIVGSHFILQSSPQMLANEVRQAVLHITKNS
ncbi:hypothetical protein L4D06_06905 [Enterovibrio makurazakiensis]|uniref:hypothetical protein n=1 Tax=Enterovibrio makurazakiensis TaxID=2910232 RepID=UPI003D1E65F7